MSLYTVEIFVCDFCDRNIFIFFIVNNKCFSKTNVRKTYPRYVGVFACVRARANDEERGIATEGWRGRQQPHLTIADDSIASEARTETRIGRRHSSQGLYFLSEEEHPRTAFGPSAMHL